MAPETPSRRLDHSEHMAFSSEPHRAAGVPAYSYIPGSRREEGTERLDLFF